jgi:hypothetical protein
MPRVESKAISEIDYDAPSATLFVRFTDGDWYRYAAVPRVLYDAFREADSHGRFFHDYIRDRFEYAKGR